MSGSVRLMFHNPPAGGKLKDVSRTNPDYGVSGRLPGFRRVRNVGGMDREVLNG